jgi:hypothetical protein
MLVWWFLVAAAIGPGFAHEGHDHGDAPQPVVGSIAPRFEARGEVFEVVGVLRGEEFHVYLDHAKTNAPFVEATIELESAGYKAAPTTTRAGTGGEFRLPAGSLARPGQYALTLTIDAGGEADLLTANFTHAAVVAGAAPAGTSTAPVAGTGIPFKTLAIVGAILLVAFGAWRLVGRST